MTYETDAVEEAIVRALRTQARAELLVLETTCEKFERSLTAPERLALAAAIGEARRVLREKTAVVEDPARAEQIEREYLDRGSNVVPLRRAK